MAGDKKRINSKAKGSEFELKVAKLLSSWWGEEFHRTPMSGGLHWKADNRVAGDIVTPPNSVFPYNVECKKREGWLFDQVLRGTGEVEDWWEQCVKDARGVGMRPWLIFARNFVPPYIMLQLEDFTPIVQTKNSRLPINYFIVSIVGQPLRVVMLLDDFLAKVQCEDILKAYNLK